METSTSSTSGTVPNFKVYPAEDAQEPSRNRTMRSATASASGPLTRMTEMAPEPTEVAGAQIVLAMFIITREVTKNPLYIFDGFVKFAE